MLAKIRSFYLPFLLLWLGAQGALWLFCRWRLPLVPLFDPPLLLRQLLLPGLLLAYWLLGLAALARPLAGRNHNTTFLLLAWGASVAASFACKYFFYLIRNSALLQF